MNDEPSTDASSRDFSAQVRTFSEALVATYVALYDQDVVGQQADPRKMRYFWSEVVDYLDFSGAQALSSAAKSDDGANQVPAGSLERPSVSACIDFLQNAVLHLQLAAPDTRRQEWDPRTPGVDPSESS